MNNINFFKDKDYEYFETIGDFSDCSLLSEFLIVDEDLNDLSDEIKIHAPECHPEFNQMVYLYKLLKLKHFEANLFTFIYSDKDRVRYAFNITCKIKRYEDIANHVWSIINK